MDNKNKIDLTNSKRPETSEIKVTDEYNSDRFVDNLTRSFNVHL